MSRRWVSHPFQPVFDENSRLLILGSMPSVKSREEGFYYGHPRNRFWQVLAAVFDAPQPRDIREKREFLLEHGIALWDAAARCEIAGSSDASIQNAVPNDIGMILSNAPIQNIYANGTAAANLYRRLILPAVGREIIPLPSTSPANAGYSLERLTCAWRVLPGD